MISKALFIGLISLFVCFQCNSQTLKDYQWSNRILVLVCDQPNIDKAKAQRMLFLQTPEELRERDMLIFNLTDGELINEKGQEIAYPAAEFPENNFQGLILLGKDGGVKLKKAFPVDTEEVFALIDSMPMRRAEMKREKKY